MSLATHTEILFTSLSVAGLAPGSIALIPESFKPTTQLRVRFGEKPVEQGNLFRVSQVKEAPTISFAAEEAGSPSTSYTLLLVDPDAPTPDDPKFAFWRHWVLSGLQPSSEEGAAAKQSKEAVTQYLAPGPKDESKPHRYLFLLYREPAGFSLSKEDVGGEEFVERRSFKADEFVARHELQLVGVNWMLGAGDGWNKEKEEL